ncbi:MAG: polysaccharide biosynthesis C-terminal domain-containing protein [Caulobacter sp.]|nr:polysaccharide biosynthesis C-terminal domain-containing protein [Caulobacter sp.]
MAISAGILIVNLGAAYLLSAFLAHTLGASGFGLYSFVISVVTILTIPALFGLPTLVAKEMAAGVAKGDYSLIEGLVRRSRQFVSVSSALMILAGLGYLAVTSEDGIRSIDPTYLWAIPLVALISWAGITAASLRGLGRVAESQWPEQVLRPVTLLILAGVFVWLNKAAFTPAVAIALTVASAILSLSVNLFQWRRNKPEALKGVAPQYADGRWIKTIIPMGLTVGILVLNAQVGIVLIGLLSSHADVAIFRVSSQTAQLCALGYTAVIMNVAPRIAAASARGDISQMKNTILQGAVFATAFAIPPALIMVLAGGRLLSFLFSPPFSAGWSSLSIMAVGQVLNAAFGCASVTLNMTGHERDCTKAFFLGLAAQVLLCVVLIPSFGVTGAAIASVAGVLVSNVTLWLVARMRTGIDAGVWAWRP